MNRLKKHKVKMERAEASTSHSREVEREHDLAYYIHDRVELMHQVFSALKYKEIKALAPVCVRHITIDDLQELCTEELLGISSKRLCAILDGAEPPSDTESSSQSPSPPLETISLDSISSDDEILSETTSSKKKKHKHHRHSSKSRRKKRSSSSQEVAQTRASRAGLTVLELLELQARARAIRAQLQQEQAAVVAESVPATAVSSPSDNEVEIKEEPAEVVEISSDDEKPSVKELETASHQPRQTELADTQTTKSQELTVTVPQAKPRKIVLKRNRMTVSVSNKPEITPEPEKKIKAKSKKKKKGKKKDTQKDGSDSDEITLQLSDSEKMDVLGSLEQKNFNNASTEDSESTSSDSEDEKKSKDKDKKDKHKSKETEIVEKDKIPDKQANLTVNDTQSTENVDTVKDKKDINQEESKKIDEQKEKENEPVIEKETCISNVEETPLSQNKEQSEDIPKDNVHNAPTEQNITTTSSKQSMDRELSEGEVSDRESSEVEAFDVPQEVVCISDEEIAKKKKKKDKKSKKGKKKKKSDFRESSDQNFYKESKKDEELNSTIDTECIILELSDDSSCYEVEGTVLSKEPTAEEIEALSAKIDEIEREEVVTDEQILEHERMLAEKQTESENLENISWKDRYLDSKKVKKVMSTSNILNAMRKKNKELKKKLEESKKEENIEENKEESKEIPEVVEENLEEGSIEHYNTLQGSTKYVDPVNDTENAEEKIGDDKKDGKVTSDMKKDAKQLLKMFKRLKKFESKMRKRL